MPAGVGWAGHGSNAVGWGRVVPSNPFSVPLAVPSPQAWPSPILWKPSHFCSQLPFTGAGLQCETGERAPLQTAAQASWGGGGEVHCLDNHHSSKNIVLDCCNMLKSQRISNSSRIHRVFLPQPQQISFPRPPWGQGRAFGKPRPETQGTLNHPHYFSFAKCSHHHVPKHSASNTVLHGGPVEHGSKGGGKLTLMWHPPPVSRTPFPYPPFPPSFTPTLPPSHIEA